MNPEYNPVELDIVAKWKVPIHGKIYVIEFEHGTTTGKRVIWVDGQEVLRRDWMFKLVGEDCFEIDKAKCCIRIAPAPRFKYIYHLKVNGKSYKQFTESQSKALKIWHIEINQKKYVVMLERETLNIYLNGEIRQEIGDFVEDGTDTHFKKDGIHFIVSARSSKNKRCAVNYGLVVNGVPVPDTPITN